MSRLELTRRLIGFNSVSSESTRTLADWASNMLGECGFRVEQHVYDVKGVEKVNVVAVKGGEGIPHLAFAGHIDTVPFTSDGWHSDPLRLTERENKFYGRGTCDMKGFVGLAMEIGSRIPTGDLKRPFGIILTSDEEVGCVGARKLVSKVGSLATNVVVGEPTSLVPYYMHKGYIYLRVWLHGVNGHSSDPEIGKSVTMLALPDAILRLNEIRDALKDVRDGRFKVPYATLNTGVVTTDTEERDGWSKRKSQKNIIADKCYLDVDVRPLPGQDVDEIVQAIRKHVAPNGTINGIKVEFELKRAPSLPFESSPDTEVVRAVEKAFGMKAATASFNTEAPIFSRAMCSCVVCGPGSIDQAHKPDEYVDAKYFSDDVSRRYENIVRQFCCTETR